MAHGRGIRVWATPGFALIPGDGCHIAMAHGRSFRDTVGAGCPADSTPGTEVPSWSALRLDFAGPRCLRFLAAGIPPSLSAEVDCRQPCGAVTIARPTFSSMASRLP